MTLANLSMSAGFFSTQSVKRREIYSVSIDLWASRFLLVLSMEFVKHFLKMNWSSSQMVTEIMREWNGGRVFGACSSMNSLKKKYSGSLSSLMIFLIITTVLLEYAFWYVGRSWVKSMKNLLL